MKAQSDLILPNPLPLSSLPSLTQEISGFFIVESHVLETTGNFRSERDVEELWDSLVMGLAKAITDSLRTETDPDVFLKAKECLLGSIMTLEVYLFPNVWSVQTVEILNRKSPPGVLVFNKRFTIVHSSVIRGIR